ncbi:hypothetical protein Y1Q_0010604 [Alligator mississippiensis]|uniref:Ig-like domain-containing protein n=1 Tax=Alligator mississippiensis TaxID=8496 RepID=A0A151PHH1_ALLMI|nr:hypothetical protein Y1Q_0010604 [Alligator mississippiensis]
MRLQLRALCLLCAVFCCGAQVSQSPEALVTREGDHSTMACAYSSAFQTFQWYRQVPSGVITHLLSVPTNRNITEGLFTGESREDGKKGSLHLSQTQMGDSGRYFCAVQDAQ